MHNSIIVTKQLKVAAEFYQFSLILFNLSLELTFYSLHNTLQLPIRTPPFARIVVWSNL